MGSSCFSRGNRINLRLIKSYIDNKGIEAEVNLAGCRCAGECTRGPAIRIDNRLFVGVDRGVLLDLLNQYLGNRKEGAHESSFSGSLRKDRVPEVRHLPPTLSGRDERFQKGRVCCHT